MDHLLPDYARWRQKYRRAAIAVYVILIFMEVAIFFVLKMSDMILQTLPVYMRRYFFTPVSMYTIIIAAALITEKYVRNEKVKNTIPVLAITLMFGVVAIIHYIFSITMFLFFVPIMMTIVFGRKRLLWIVTGLSSGLVCHVLAHYIWTKLPNKIDPYFVPSFLIAQVGIFVCAFIAATLIDLLNTQNEKLIKAVEEADKANKMKSSFLSNMSHEIRTPMNAIVGITDIMLRTKRPPVDEKYLLNIKHSGAALLAIINDILDFSKIESGKMELVEGSYSLYGMLDDLSLIFWNRIGDKKTEFIYDIDPGIPDILYGDALRVRQVVINLVNNAVKFTEEGFVRLSIELKNKVDDDLELAVSVSDSGQGIKPEDFEKIFMSFEQLNTRRNHKKEGTGLGLAISKKLVSMMGGELKVESEYGVGTTFYFTIHQKMAQNSEIPDYSEIKNEIENRKVSVNLENEYLCAAVKRTLLSVGVETSDDGETDICFTDVQNFDESRTCRQIVLINPYLDTVKSHEDVLIRPLYPDLLKQVFCGGKEPRKSTDDAHNETNFAGAKILIAEDNEINAGVAQMLLEPFQMEIDIAQNGQIACDMVRSKKYDLVFMDHMMPVMDGVEATKMIRSFEGDYYKNLPIIALTANGISEAKGEFLAAGMNDITVKPISMEHIAEILNRWLRIDKSENKDK